MAGERLPGSEGADTQDSVMVNSPAFAAPDPKAFLKTLTLLAKTTDRGEGAKTLLSSLFRAAETVVEAVGGQSAFLSTLGGAKPVHPLGATYYTQTPYRYGDYIAKLSLAPVSPWLKALADETVDAHGCPDAIREVVRESLIEQSGTWALRVQLCTDLNKMPIEDPSVVRDEQLDPFVTIATLDIAPQVAWERGVSDRTEDALSFSPWHGLAAHQPLGGVNRARKDPYDMSAGFRGRFNGCPMHEPATLTDLPA